MLLNVSNERIIPTDHCLFILILKVWSYSPILISIIFLTEANSMESIVPASPLIALTAIHLKRLMCLNIGYSLSETLCIVCKLLSFLLDFFFFGWSKRLPYSINRWVNTTHLAPFISDRRPCLHQIVTWRKAQRYTVWIFSVTWWPV